MLTAQGDIFDPALLATVNAVCITTNGITDRNGHAVMGAGVALTAAKKWESLKSNLGILLRRNGNIVQEPAAVFGKDGLNYVIVSFPTKDHWKNKSTIELITRSAKQLVELTDKRNWTKVILPPPGCGLGGLSWESQVRPVLEEIFDNRFTVIFKR